MATLTIHNVPERLHARLAARAAAHRRSPDEEALSVLDEALSVDVEPDARAEAAFARLDTIRERLRQRALDLDPVQIIREGRDSGYGRERP